MKKFNEFLNEEYEDQDTWKDVFRRQVSTGNYWQKLFKEEFDRHQFLDRSDAVYICKKAQADILQEVIDSLDKNKDKLIINDINDMIKKVWKSASKDSALGMIHNGKQL